jgi:hypothetical protein
MDGIVWSRASPIFIHGTFPRHEELGSKSVGTAFGNPWDSEGSAAEDFNGWKRLCTVYQ